MGHNPGGSVTMTKKLFKPNVEENLNVPHTVTLTEGQISTILYVLEGYVAGLDDVVTQDENDKELIKDVDNIFEILETSVDNYYNSISESNNNLSEITPVRDAQAAKNKDLKYAQSPENIIANSVNEASEDCEDEYNFIEHTSECA